MQVIAPGIELPTDLACTACCAVMADAKDVKDVSLVQNKEGSTSELGKEGKEGTSNPKELEVTAQPGKSSLRRAALA